MKIYTKKGDEGKTSLFGGTKISKDDIQIEAYGTVDELNAQIGLLLSHDIDVENNNLLKTIQWCLFDIGSHLASDGTATEYLPKLPFENVEALELAMDKMDETLPALKNFILPGGHETVAQAHVCRTVCRRAERRVVSYAQHHNVSAYIVRYLNRLSDYFFVLARYTSGRLGIDEVKWNSK